MSHGPAWSKKELRLLGRLPDRELARRLGRTYRAVQARRKRMGIDAATHPERTWTASEDVLARADRLTLRQIAVQLGRTVDSVKCRRRRLRAARP